MDFNEYILPNEYKTLLEAHVPSQEQPFIKNFILKKRNKDYCCFDLENQYCKVRQLYIPLNYVVVALPFKKLQNAKVKLVMIQKSYKLI